MPDTKEIKNPIIQKFKDRVTNEAFVPDCLYQLTIETGKRGEVIAKKDIIAMKLERLNIIKERKARKAEEARKQRELIDKVQRSLQKAQHSNAVAERVTRGKRLLFLQLLFLVACLFLAWRCSHRIKGT